MNFNCKHAIYAVAISGMVGCAVVPTVEINKITKPSDLKGDELDTFFIQKSTIKIDKSGTNKNAQGNEIDVLEISSIPEEFTKFKFGLRRADGFGVKTNLNLTKVSNTDLIKEAGVEVIDNRVETIGKIGAIVTKLIPIAFDSTKGLVPDSLPKKINTAILLEANSVGRDEMKNLDAADGVSISFGALPPDAALIESFVTPAISNGLIYSACRQATIRFKYRDNQYEQTVKISDPRFYQRVSFPVKGKVSFHSECGVSVEANKETGVASSATVVEALIAQGKAIKDAIDAAAK